MKEVYGIGIRNIITTETIYFQPESGEIADYAQIEMEVLDSWSEQPFSEVITLDVAEDEFLVFRLESCGEFEDDICEAVEWLVNKMSELDCFIGETR